MAALVGIVRSASGLVADVVAATVGWADRAAAVGCAAAGLPDLGGSATGGLGVTGRDTATGGEVVELGPTAAGALTGGVTPAEGACTPTIVLAADAPWRWAATSAVGTVVPAAVPGADGELGRGIVGAGAIPGALVCCCA